MDIIKEKVSNWLGYFKDYINYFQIVEQQKNVVYFSKFNLVTNEFFEIHNFVLTLKTNLFRSLIEQFKYCANNFLIFGNNNLSEKEKVMVLYSACFLNYYKKFCFDINHTFEEYYDDNFIYLIKTVFKFDISNKQLFRIFCFCFFDKMKEEIGNLNYEKIKPLKLAYNPTLYNNNLKVSNNNNLNTNLDSNSENNNNININSINQMNVEESGGGGHILTYLISAKEKIVDLVFEMRYRGIFPKACANEINRMNDRLHRLGENSAQELHNLNNFQEMNIKNDTSFINSFNNSTFKSNDNNINNINIINDEKNKFNESSMNSINNTFNSLMTDSSSINIYSNNNNTKSTNINLNNNNKINVNNINQNLNKINFINTGNSEQSSINSINTDDMNNNNININNVNIKNLNNINNEINLNNNNNSAFKPRQNTDISNSPQNMNNNMYSQRIISALMKNEVDDKTLEIIKNVARKIDEQYLHTSLNNKQKPIIIIKYFSCYIVEFTPEMLQKIEPQYKDILNNFCIKFIILAKELYNTTMELFCAIYDLSYTNIDTFLDLSRNCGIQVKYAQGLYKFFKDYSLLLLEKNSTHNLKNTVQKLIEKEKVNWERIINHKSDDSLPFFKVNNI